MGQTSIGQAALILTTNGSSLRSGLQLEDNFIRAWADRVKTRLEGIWKGTDVLKDGKVVGQVGGLKEMIHTIGAVAAPVGAAGMLAFAASVETVRDVSKQGAMAKALGLTAEQFTGMAGVAKTVGEDTREFIESIVTMGKLGADAAAGVGEVAGPAFEKLGLDAQAFIKLRPDEQFFAMHAALRRLGPGLEQTRLLMTAFGEDGGKFLLPILGKSTDELKQMAGGLQISSQQMAVVTRAGEAFQRTQTAIANLWRRIVVYAAPVLEFLATEITYTVDQFGKMESTAVPALAKVLRLTAQLADATKAVTAATLIASGARLKFLSLEILARGAMGGLKGLAVAGVTIAALEGLGVGAAAREAGGVLMDLGGNMLKDLGGSSERVEKFINGLEGRDKAGKGGAAGDRRLAAVAADAASDTAGKIVSKVVDMTTNPALLSGSQADIAARSRLRFGEVVYQKEVLKEHKKGNKHLEEIEKGVKQKGRRLEFDEV